LVDDFVGEGASSHMVPTVTVMYFLHHSSSFVWPKTSQIWVRVEDRVGFLVQGIPEECVPGGHILELSCFCLIIEECFIL